MAELGGSAVRSEKNLAVHDRAAPQTRPREQADHVLLPLRRAFPGLAEQADADVVADYRVGLKTILQPRGERKTRDFDVGGDENLVAFRGNNAGHADADRPGKTTAQRGFRKTGRQFENFTRGCAFRDLGLRARKNPARGGNGGGQNLRAADVDA